MNSTPGKSIARLACSMATNEPPDKVPTKKAPESIDAEVTDATRVDVIAHKLPANDEDPTKKEATNPPIEAIGVDAIAHKLPANDEDPTEKEAEKEAEKGKEKEPPIDGPSKAPETVRLVVLPPSQLNEMSPPPPRKLRSASRKSNRDPSPKKKKLRRFSPRNYSRCKDASPPVEFSFESDKSSSSVTSALTTQSKVGSTTSSANNRAIVVFNAAVADKSPEKESVTDILLKLEQDDVEGGMEGVAIDNI